MVKVLHKEQSEVSMDYVNLPDASTRSGSRKQNAAPGRNVWRVVAVGFGLLCILQVALNVSLRLALFGPDSQTSGFKNICSNLTQNSDKLRQLTDQYLQQGWIYLPPSLYYISSFTKSWEESRKDCQQRDAELVIINTKQEQDFTRQFHRLTWIGLTKSRIGKWRWVDGTPLTKSYWDQNEPNGFEGKNEDCVEIRFFDNENSWNDIPCENPNFWICEKNLTQQINIWNSALRL